MTVPGPTLRVRILAVGVVLVAILVVTGYTSALAFARVSRAMGAAVRDDSEAAGLLSTLAGALEDEDDVLLMSLSGEATATPEAVAVERDRFDRAQTRLAALTTDAAERALMRELSQRVHTYRSLVDATLPMGGTERARDIYRQRVAPLVRQGTGLCGQLREHRFRATEDLAAAARDEARRATVVVSVASVFSIALFVAIAWYVARSVLAPLRELTSTVDAMRDGDFDRRVELSSKDEFGKLGIGFNRMADAVGEFRRSKLGEVLALNATLEAALEALPEVVLVVDSAGTIAKMNARARSLLEGLLGRVPQTLNELPLPDYSRQRLAEAITGAEPKNPPRADLGRSIPFQVGAETRRFSLRILPVKGTVAAPVDAVVVLDDVTEFARLDEMRTEFIAAASHELRTPLTTLQMALALLAEAAPTLTPAQRETIAAAELGCEQLSATVDEFLDLATLDAGMIDYERSRIDMTSWLRDMTGVIMARFQERGLTLETTVECAHMQVEGDRRRLSTALSNVLTNALKYSPSGGTVQIHAEALANSVQITVDDEGPGVPESLRHRIFEKYFRVEHERSHEYRTSPRGAGIGLYLCRQIVEAHLGAAHCEASPKGGTRIRLMLPLARRSGGLWNRPNRSEA